MMPHDDPPELGNEDPQFEALLERARDRTSLPGGELYSEMWVRTHLPPHAFVMDPEAAA
jgi:hypothetical protein